jgi:aspartate kinase
MLHAAKLVREAREKASVVAVVSAMKGVTDDLIGIACRLKEGDHARAGREARQLVQSHLDVLDDLHFKEAENRRVRQELQLLGRDLLQDVPSEAFSEQKRFVDGALQDRVASYGERFSARLFAAALEKSGVRAVPVSSSEFLVTCETFRNAKPDLEETRRRGRGILLPLLESDLVPVVTGFLGATKDGRLTTLGRNSSDYSGAIIAHVVNADELVIWTDVDGIYTRNPKESAEARLLQELSYDEAHALTAAGAKVLHSKVLPLAAEKGMLVWVRNTFNPQLPGTKIGPARDRSNQRGEA